MTVVLTVKTQRKRISSNLKNGSPTNPIRHELVCEKNVFCYLDFRSYLEDNYPKSLPFALKITLAFEIHCKKHLPTLKTSVSCISGEKTSTLPAIKFVYNCGFPILGWGGTYVSILFKIRAINTHIFYKSPNPFDSRSLRFTTRQICTVEHVQEAFSLKNYFRPRPRSVASSI